MANFEGCRTKTIDCVWVLGVTTRDRESPALVPSCACVKFEPKSSRRAIIVLFSACDVLQQFAPYFPRLFIVCSARSRRIWADYHRYRGGRCSRRVLLSQRVR